VLTVLVDDERVRLPVLVVDKIDTLFGTIDVSVLVDFEVFRRYGSLGKGYFDRVGLLVLDGVVVLGFVAPVLASLGRLQQAQRILGGCSWIFGLQLVDDCGVEVFRNGC